MDKLCKAPSFNQFFSFYQCRTYDGLRKAHDAQIVKIATEAGLHILPDQWSSLLYGDQDHKSHMQSIIDKVRFPKDPSNIGEYHLEIWGLLH